MVPQFQSLEVLQEHGIAANDIQKLQNSGYHTVESVRSNCNLSHEASMASCCILVPHGSLTPLPLVPCLNRSLMPLPESCPMSREFLRPRSPSSRRLSNRWFPWSFVPRPMLWWIASTSCIRSVLYDYIIIVVVGNGAFISLILLRCCRVN